MARRKQRAERAGNEGIQAQSVKADVLAVGRGAKAIKVVKGSVESLELIKAIAELRQGLDTLKLDAAARAVVEEDVSALGTEAEKKQPDAQEVSNLLQRIAGKLKMVGVVLTEAIALSEPIKRIAELAGVSLKSLGLL